MEEWITYSYATSITERIKAWETINEPNEQRLAYKNWLSRKSLLSQQDYERLFQSYCWNEDKVSKGLLPITQERASLLMPIVKQSDWFSLHQKLFQQECPLETHDLTEALRFHLAYYDAHIQKCLIEYPMIQLSRTSIKQVKQQLQEELFYIAQKTLVWDVHQMLEEHPLNLDSKEEEFIQYINEFLGDAQRTYLLYGEYPTLARLLAIRLTFACKAIEEFIYSLAVAANQLMEVFSVSIPFILTEIKLGQGDSHDEGKTVIYFQVQKQSFVFKPKNLEIADRFNELLSFFETLDQELCFYKIKRVVTPTFTIEECVPHQTCTSEEELRTYYQRYGQLLSVVYWLGSTDLHMENLIASASFPVLIDVETVIQPKIFQKIKKTSRKDRIEKASVLISGLLPTKNITKDGITFDALSGKKQKLKQQVSRLQKNKASDLSFQLEDGYMEGAQNLPMLNGVEADYRHYQKTIESSFRKMNTLLLGHKASIIEKISKLFANMTVRLIYRDTQNYTDMLDFSVHVDCMSDYIEREKLISNLWANQGVPQRLIPFEVQALLVQDIPYFTANTSKKSIFIAGHEVAGVLAETPLEVTVRHLEQLNELTCNFSYELMRETLGTLEYRLQKVSLAEQNKRLASPLLSKAADIGDTIKSNLFNNQTEGMVDWIYSSLTIKGQPILSYPQKDLYAGGRGVYLFFMTLNHFVPKKDYQELLLCWEQELFRESNEADYFETGLSAFFGIGSSLLVAFYGWQLTGEEKYQKQVEKELTSLFTMAETDCQQSLDWLDGLASFVALLAAIYRVCQDSVSRELLIKYTARINCREMEDNSFGHGYAGVLYALKQSNQLLNDQNIQHRIVWYLERAERIKGGADGQRDDSFCRSSQGVEKCSEEKMLERVVKQLELNERNDSCICHGLYGQLDKHLELTQLLINQPIYLKGDSYSPAIGLFCGLSGIGYQLLRAYAPTKIKSILFIN